MRTKKMLQWVLLLSGGISACNLLTLYFLPFVFPMANFSIIKLAFIAIAENNLGYIFLSGMLTVFLLIGAISLKNNRILVPFFAFAVFLSDFIHVSILFVGDLMSGFVNKTVIWSGIIDVVAVILFAVYFTNWIKNRKQDNQHS